MSAPIETLIPGHTIRLHGFVPLAPWHAECTCEWTSPEHDRLLPVSAATVEHLRAVTS